MYRTEEDARQADGVRRANAHLRSKAYDYRWQHGNKNWFVMNFSFSIKLEYHEMTYVASTVYFRTKDEAHEAMISMPQDLKKYLKSRPL